MLHDNLIHNLEVSWLVPSNHRLSGKLARRTYFKSNSKQDKRGLKNHLIPILDIGLPCHTLLHQVPKVWQVLPSWRQNLTNLFNMVYIQL